MNPLAYFTVELMGQRRREGERAVRLRRERVGDDEPLVDARDRRWAAAIRRFATGAEAGRALGHPAAESPGPQHRTRPEPASNRPVPTR